ncbi:hypothetical protein CHS0354_042110 [Potamilus streckersoni]|uniref:nitric-oxide synthase (NADPH) n=1 Tax=Potamilus streckersoni TaxID=2493646 RepID=A0AAE0WHL4_9BIVA|nr:hypothetical protein CHS0354_042110 [Potamilus streckersoni]
MENSALSPNIIQVKLTKQPQYGLGFQLRNHTNRSCVVISDIVRGGSAAASGLVQAGDILAKVNDISLRGMSCEEADNILQLIPVDSQVILLIQCEDGNTTHLETRYSEDGLPRTVRITKPINQPETFISIIKRTFCSSNKVTDANGDNTLEAVYVEDIFEPHSSVNTQKKAVKLINTANERPAHMDTLYMKALGNTGCTSERCVGSMMLTPPTQLPGTSRSKTELISQAKDFMVQYYGSMKGENKADHQKRWEGVLTSIKKTGTYELTIDELTFGAKTAWRNAPRCIGRIQWSKLQVFDARHITTARGMFEAICNHIKYGTNNGNIRCSNISF